MDPTEHLRAAFIASHIGPPAPDLTLRLDQYEWKIHSSVFIDKSTFFKAALEGDFKEKKDKEFILHDDDPFTFARLIEFAYTGNYSYPPQGATSEDPGLSNFVTAIMQPFLDNGAANAADLERERARSMNDVHCEVIQLADKYGISSLIDHAVQCAQWSVDKTDIWTLRDQIGTHVIERHRPLQDMLAKMVARKFEQLDHEKMQEWFEDGPRFGYKLAQMMNRMRKSSHCQSCPSRESWGIPPGPCDGSWG